MCERLQSNTFLVHKDRLHGQGRRVGMHVVSGVTRPGELLKGVARAFLTGELERGGCSVQPGVSR